MVAPMYMVLKVVLDRPLVRSSDSVNAQNPMDCPGSAAIITAQDRAKITQFLILLLAKTSTMSNFEV
jgi:hypothetical protein